MIGKANTAVLANVMGLHRRGVFYKDVPRQIVYLNFRLMESFSNTIANFKGKK